MRMLYSPAVLLLCAVCSVSVVQADVKTVKLCGRELIRAVVYTCGGSRWRRFSPKDMEGEFAMRRKIQDNSESSRAS